MSEFRQLVENLTEAQALPPRLVRAIDKLGEVAYQRANHDAFVMEVVPLLRQDAYEGDLSGMYQKLGDARQHVTKQLHAALEDDESAGWVNDYRRVLRELANIQGIVSNDILSRRQTIDSPDETPEHITGGAIREVETYLNRELRSRKSMGVGEVYKAFAHVMDRKTVREALDVLHKQGTITRSGRFVRLPPEPEGGEFEDKVNEIAGDQLGEASWKKTALGLGVAGAIGFGGGRASAPDPPEASVSQLSPEQQWAYLEGEYGVLSREFSKSEGRPPNDYLWERVKKLREGLSRWISAYRGKGRSTSRGDDSYGELLSKVEGWISQWEGSRPGGPHGMYRGN